MDLQRWPAAESDMIVKDEAYQSEDDSSSAKEAYVYREQDPFAECISSKSRDGVYQIGS